MKRSINGRNEKNKRQSQDVKRLRMVENDQKTELRANKSPKKVGHPI